MKRVKSKIYFKKAEDGGRSEAIPLIKFGCPVFFENIPALSRHGYDCRLLIGEYGREIFPGDFINEIAMIFLSEDEVVLNINIGARFTLWEGKIIASGEVLRIEGV
jgi:hypothetical protein